MCSGLPLPAFGSSPNLEALALEASKSEVQDEDVTVTCGNLLRYTILRFKFVVLVYVLNYLIPIT